MCGMAFVLTELDRSTTNNQVRLANMVDVNAFSDLVDEIMSQGFDGETAAEYAALTITNGTERAYCGVIGTATRTSRSRLPKDRCI